MLQYCLVATIYISRGSRRRCFGSGWKHIVVIIPARSCAGHGYTLREGDVPGVAAQRSQALRNAAATAWALRWWT